MDGSSWEDGGMAGEGAAPTAARAGAPGAAAAPIATVYSRRYSRSWPAHFATMEREMASAVTGAGERSRSIVPPAERSSETVAAARPVPDASWKHEGWI